MASGGVRPGAGRPRKAPKRITRERALFLRIYLETHEQLTALRSSLGNLSQAEIIEALIRAAFEKECREKEKQRLEEETRQNILAFLQSLPEGQHKTELDSSDTLVNLIADPHVDSETRDKILKESGLTTLEKIGKILAASQKVYEVNKALKKQFAELATEDKAAEELRNINRWLGMLDYKSKSE